MAANSAPLLLTNIYPLVTHSRQRFLLILVDVWGHPIPNPSPLFSDFLKIYPIRSIYITKIYHTHYDSIAYPSCSIFDETNML